MEQQPKVGRKMSSCTEAKDSLLEGTRELNEGGKKKARDKDSKPTDHDTLLPLDELEKELVSLKPCLSHTVKVIKCISYMRCFCCNWVVPSLISYLTLIYNIKKRLNLLSFQLFGYILHTLCLFPVYLCV